MTKPSALIAQHADRVAGRLAFDRALARRVRQEIEDHLTDAVAAAPARDRVEAERAALARFGDPDRIAAQFAGASLAKQARSAGAAAVLMMAGVFFAMKLRLAWYGLMALPAAERFHELGRFVLLADRIALWLAAIAAIGAWLCVYRRQAGAQRIFALCAISACSLATSIACDAVLTWLRVDAAGWSSKFVLPGLLMALEVACAAVLFRYLRRISAARNAQAAG